MRQDRAFVRAIDIDDSNLPPLEAVWEARGVNPWLSAEEERKAFIMDPRFEVNLFAGEEEFPEIACPINMRWDSRGRLWVILRPVLHPLYRLPIYSASMGSVFW